MMQVPALLRSPARFRLLVAGAFVLLALGVAIMIKLERIADRNQQLNDGEVALKMDDGPTGVRKLEPLARSGDKTAQSILGEVYAFGVVAGVPKNDELAIRWFRAAGPMSRDPRKGEDPAAESEYWVGRAYADGGGPVDQNLVESRKWLERAAQGGSREAAEMLKRKQ
jgi:TPR repeat protein